MLTGNVAAPSGARTVLFQAQQAFDTPYTNITGQDESVAHVYVITPHAASPDAIESIKGALGNRSGQTTFLCGNDLLDIFKEKWPSFLALQGDFLGRYLNDLRLNVDSDPNLSALILQHSIIAPANRFLSAVYVTQPLSIRLAEFKGRTLSWYPSLLTGPVSLSEIHDAKFNLSILAAILSQARIWTKEVDRSAAWSKAGHLLQRVITGVTILWEEGYREHLRKCPPGEAPPREHAILSAMYGGVASRLFVRARRG